MSTLFYYGNQNLQKGIYDVKNDGTRETTPQDVQKKKKARSNGTSIVNTRLEEKTIQLSGLLYNGANKLSDFQELIKKYDAIWTNEEQNPQHFLRVVNSYQNIFDTSTMSNWQETDGITAIAQDTADFQNETGEASLGFGIAAWYSSSWTNRIRITIPAASVNGDLADFPVFVDLVDLPLNFFDNVKSDGTDIVVTDSTGDTKLNRELTSIDATNLTGELWFQAASLSSTNDNVFYIYFGNSGASETNDTGTWDSDYQGVYHLDDLTTSSVDDSTSNGNDGAKLGANEPVEATGQIYEGQDFDGTDDYITYNSLLDEQLTFEFWVKNSDWTQTTFYVNNTDTDSKNRIYISSDTNSFYYGWRYDDDGNDQRVTVTRATAGLTVDDQWYHIAVTMDSNSGTHKLYVDGSLVDSGSKVSRVGTHEDPTYMGTLASGGSPFDGMIDEFRASTNIRTAAYVKTTFDNQNDASSFYNIYATDLVTDGGFENFTGTPDDNTTDTFTSWTNTLTGASYVDANTADKRKETYCLKLHRAASETAAIYQDITLQQHTKYTLSYWAKSDGANGTAGLQLRTLEADSRYLQDGLTWSKNANTTISGTAITTGDVTYTKKTVSITTPDYAGSYRLTAVNSAGGAGHVFIDGISLTLASDDTSSVTLSYIGSSQDLSSLTDTGNFELFNNLPDTQYISSVDFRIGNDNENYYSYGFTSDYMGNALHDNWNLFSASWDNPAGTFPRKVTRISETGTVDDSALSYCQITINLATNFENVTNCNLDFINWVNEDRTRNFPCYRQTISKTGDSHEIDHARWSGKLVNYTGYGQSTHAIELFDQNVTGLNQLKRFEFDGSLSPLPLIEFDINDATALNDFTLQNIKTDETLTLSPSTLTATDKLKFGGLDMLTQNGQDQVDFSGIIPSFDLGVNRYNLVLGSNTADTVTSVVTYNTLTSDNYPSSSDWRSQKFTATKNGKVSEVTLRLGYFTPTLPEEMIFTIALYSDAAGDPNALIEAQTINFGGSPPGLGGGAWGGTHTAYFTSATVVNATDYHVVVYTNQAQSGSINLFSSLASGSDTRESSDTGASWANIANNTFYHSIKIEDSPAWDIDWRVLYNKLYAA